MLRVELILVRRTRVLGHDFIHDASDAKRVEKKSRREKTQPDKGEWTAMEEKKKKK